MVEKMESVFNISGCAVENQGNQETGNRSWEPKSPGETTYQAYTETFPRLSIPKTLDETIELANDLMDRKLLTMRKGNLQQKEAMNSSRNNHGHQQQNPSKGRNVARAYNRGQTERKPNVDP
ncbi:hypothetical protein Tco_1067409 [Tanacetum coccineum]|uniref:Reverse transcriptase domain-containing protein n=1 Tax=Tanacetum coccineum TaxID=301880 RepID=A0ABQ5HEG3_9ASTR